MRFSPRRPAMAELLTGLCRLLLAAGRAFYRLGTQPLPAGKAKWPLNLGIQYASTRSLAFAAFLLAFGLALPKLAPPALRLSPANAIHRVLLPGVSSSSQPPLAPATSGRIEG